MQNPMYGMPNYSFQSPFGNGMNTSYQNQQLPHYDIVKVNGRNGAEAFQMGPNSQVLLLDETAPVLWLASTDGAGYKTVSAFDISPHQDQQQTMLSSIEQRLARLEEYIYEPSESGSRDAKQRNPKQRNNGQQQSNANEAQFAEFKKTMQGKNPEAIVKQMLANGQMSQAQFEQLKQQASLMQAFFK